MSTAVLDAPGELRALLREVAAADGVRRILDRLARRLGSTVVLVDQGGGTIPAGRAVPATIVADAGAVAAGRVDAVSASLDGRPACVLPIMAPRPCPVLVARKDVAGHDFSAAERALLSDATIPLGIAWREREARLREARLARAEARNREAVLYLLQAGDTAGARRAAAALGPALPETIRLHLVECAGRPVAEALRWCTEAAAGTAWIVRCPVNTRHVVVIARDDADALVAALRARAAADAAYHVGSSGAVPVAEFGVAYRHAFHALSVARHRPQRYAEFRARGDLAELLAGVGAGWAASMLAPLLAYRPVRPQDPDAGELVFTLTSWLTFHSRAVRHLKLHRNTLAARLRLVGSVLGVDLGDVATQARLHLAVQIVGPSGAAVEPFARLMSRPEVRCWAEQQRAPLRGSDPRLVDTLRAWLGCGAQIGPAAATLGISPSGVRKRLVRVEQLTQRSLLDSPSARYDLCLALEQQALEQQALEQQALEQQALEQHDFQQQAQSSRLYTAQTPTNVPAATVPTV